MALGPGNKAETSRQGLALIAPVFYRRETEKNIKHTSKLGKFQVAMSVTKKIRQGNGEVMGLEGHSEKAAGEAL